VVKNHAHKERLKMDTISQNKSDKNPPQPKENHENSVKGRLAPAAPQRQSGFPFGKIIASAAILMMLVVIQIGPWRNMVFHNDLFQTADRVAEEYVGAVLLCVSLSEASRSHIYS
jgi:hypothetical protein